MLFYTALGKSGPDGAEMALFVGFRFSAGGGSGFGCQGTAVLNPDTSTLTPETISYLQHVVRKNALSAYFKYLPIRNPKSGRLVSL
jgi:hypothetical protein